MNPDRLPLLVLLAITAGGCQPEGPGNGTGEGSDSDFPWWDVVPAPNDDDSAGDDDHEDGVEALWFGAGSLAPGEWFTGEGGFSVVEYQAGSGTELCRIGGQWTSTTLRFDCAGCDYAFELEWIAPFVEADEGNACLAYGVNPGALPQEPLLLGFSDDIAWSFDGELWTGEGSTDQDGDVMSWEIPATAP